MEHVSGSGVDEVGKRIFVNSDDDNENGKPDAFDDKADYTGPGLDDKNFATIVMDAEPIASLSGYSLWVVRLERLQTNLTSASAQFTRIFGDHVRNSRYPALNL